MKNRTLRALLCVLLAAAALVSLCGCDDKKDNDAYPVIDHEDITDYCYIGQEGNKKTYTCAVSDKYGNTQFLRTDLKVPPTVEAINDNVLCIYQRFGALTEGSWAVYCDVKNGGVSKVFGNVLGFKGMTIAYTDYLTNAHHIFVRDAVDESVYFKHYTLEDADEGKPVLGGKFNKDGDLEVTYLSGAKEKTIVVEMPK